MKFMIQLEGECLRNRKMILWVVLVCCVGGTLLDVSRSAVLISCPVQEYSVSYCNHPFLYKKWIIRGLGIQYFPAPPYHSYCFLSFVNTNNYVKPTGDYNLQQFEFNTIIDNRSSISFKMNFCREQIMPENQQLLSS